MRYKNNTDVSDIGKVVDIPAESDEEGNRTRQATFKNGYFVVSVEPVADWEEWRVVNGEPLPRVFAGRLESSTLYKFPSKAAFENAFDTEVE